MSGKPAIHVAAIRSRADWIRGLIDPTANGRLPPDGRKLIRMYRQLGLYLCFSDNPLESEISGIQQKNAIGTPQGVLVVPSLKPTLFEIARQRLFFRIAAHEWNLLQMRSKTSSAFAIVTADVSADQLTAFRPRPIRPIE